MTRFKILLFILYASTCFGQTPEEEVLFIKSRLDSIETFEVDIRLHLNISFIDMPDKQANGIFKKGEDMLISSEDFALIPKRGLDLSFSELFANKFMVIDRGTIDDESASLAVSILPLDDKSNFSVANLHIDTKKGRITYAQINTKKDGTYTLNLEYLKDQDILPNKLAVFFEIDRIKIPLNFAGGDVSIDRKKMRKMDEKTGEIILSLHYRNVQKTY